MIPRQEKSASRISPIAALLTIRRIRDHALILAFCLWGVCAIDFATPGVFDRAGNIKFQDFLSFYISGGMVAQGRASALYDESARRTEMLAIARPIDVAHDSVFPPTAHTPRDVRLPNLYGPQVALLFVPLARLPFLIAAQVWIVLSLLVYFGCMHAIWKSCDGLRSYQGLATIAAIAFPPLFHFFVRGQLSALLLFCVTAAFFAMQSDRYWLAGIALGFLIFKPQFLVAIPLILLTTRSWRILAGLVTSAAAQLALTRFYFGPAVMGDYFNMLRRVPEWVDVAELRLAPIQMHSLRSFWEVLLPSDIAVWIVYLLSSVAVIVIAALIWKSSSPLTLRFSALILAAVLVNPHIYIYDLLVLAPIFLLLTNWSIENAQHASTPALRILLYFAFLLPLFGSLARWTHVQLSVITFAALLWTLHRIANAKLANGVPAMSAA